MVHPDPDPADIKSAKKGEKKIKICPKNSFTFSLKVIHNLNI